ncbi:MAG: hypothetical protein ACRDU0_08250, partial [Mycobacterium sp.]
MGPIADLELGSPEELGVRFGRQDARHPQGFLLGFLADEGRQALGFRFLFRGEDKVGHEQFRGKRGVDFQNPSASGFTVRKTHPLFSCLPCRHKLHKKHLTPKTVAFLSLELVLHLADSDAISIDRMKR